VLVVSAALSLALLVPSDGAAQVASKCLSAKYQAVGQFVKRDTACRAKAAKKGLAIDSACQQKAAAKLAKGFQKAEAKGDCLTTADLVPVQGVLEADLETYTNALEVKLGCCSLGGGLCSAMLSDADCVAYGGALGFPNTACDGATGNCVEEPVAGGCCHDLVESDTKLPCVGGAGASEPSCAAGSGTFTADAVCANSGLCTPLP
jgi:hypothetical protein